MGTRISKNVLGIILFVLCTSLLFQNCGGTGTGTPVKSTPQNVQVACVPANDCLHYSLTTYGNADCNFNYSRVVVDNLPSTNGPNMTAVDWGNRCLARSAIEACCPSGLITASFRNFSGDHSVAISFEVDPNSIYSTSNKMESF